MGQAKRRGTYEERVEQSQLAEQIIAQAFQKHPKQAYLILTQQFKGDKRAFAKDILRRQLNDKSLTEVNKSAKP